jgi:hypothetical protein
MGGHRSNLSNKIWNIGIIVLNVNIRRDIRSDDTKSRNRSRRSRKVSKRLETGRRMSYVKKKRT